MRVFYASLLLAAAASPASAELLYGLSDDNRLFTFDSANAAYAFDARSIAGLGAGETLVGIDVRPNDGKLYALSDQSIVYRIDIDGTTATAVSVTQANAFTLSGTAFGFDFNPVPDRTRIVSDSDQNLRFNQTNGLLVQPDGTLKYDDTAADGDPVDVNAGANPNIVGAGYTNSTTPSPRTPPPGTLLYVIDSDLDSLAIQDPPNAGTLNTVGALGVDAPDLLGFDISGLSGQAFAAWTGTDGSMLYAIDLLTGAASLVGGIGGDFTIVGLATGAVPEPGVVGLLGGGLAGLVALRRRRRS